MKRLVLLLAGAMLATVALADDSAKDTFKKTEKGFGNLLQGMGQEIGKVTDPKSAKKSEKKAAKAKDEKK